MNKILSILFFMLFAAAVSTSAAQEKIVTVDIAPDGVQRIELTAGSYFFEPNHIIVKQNIPVEIIIKTDGGIVPHDIVMNSPEAGIEFDRELSVDPVTIRFTPVRQGTYPFYCNKKLLFFKSHREQGMEGVLEVR